MYDKHLQVELGSVCACIAGAYRYGSRNNELEALRVAS